MSFLESATAAIYSTQQCRLRENDTYLSVGPFSTPNRPCPPLSSPPPPPFALFSVLAACFHLFFSCRALRCHGFSFAPTTYICVFAAFSFALRRTTGTTMIWTMTSATSSGRSSKRRGQWGRRQAKQSHNHDRSIEANQVEKQARDRTAWIREFFLSAAPADAAASAPPT